MTDQIVMLRGPERVRKRPGVIFGSEDIRGAMAAFHMLLAALAAECANGHCTQITVTQYPDHSLELQDNGRGIFLGTPGSGDDTVWNALFCQLYADPVCQTPTTGCLFEEPLGEPGEVAGSFELCAVQYASEFMDVQVIRNGFRQCLRFEKGTAIGGMAEMPCQEPAGTMIRFKPDPEVFTDVALPPRQISDALQNLALQVPGMTAIFRRETAAGPKKTTFCYPNSIADYLRERNKNRDASPVYHKALSAEGQERYNQPLYTAAVKTGICFAKNAGFIACHHNQTELTHGGTHRDVAVEEIGKYLAWMLECRIKEEDLLKHLQLVIVSNSELTSWMNGTRTCISNTLIRDLTQDTIGDDFQHYVKQNADLLRALFHP